ncbi:MAG: radical SAM protein [Nitrospirota bacterium]
MGYDLKIISWNITRRCNIHCNHCYLPANNIKGSPELNTEEALHVIDQIALVNPEVMLILSGGEPLLRNDIFELTGYASGKGMMVVLGSNGLLIDEEVAFNLRQSSVSGVSISLDSIDPEIHDSIRSLKGAWERAVEAIKICQSNGLAVQVNTVVTKNNYDEIPELIRYSKTLGAKVFSPFFLVCTGRGEEVTDIAPEQYEQILPFIAESQGKHDGMMIRPRCAPTFRRILYQCNPNSPLLKMDTGRCLAGIHYCRITPEGDVTPCPYMPLSVGNIKDKSFKNLWEDSEEFISLRTPSLKGKCRLCEFQLICGGCRARAFSSYKDYMEEDPWCLYIPKGEEIINPPAFSTHSSESNPSALCEPLWTEEAEERLKKVPFFVRSMVRAAIERYAIENGYKEITPKIMEEARHKLTMGKMAGH